MAKFETVDEYIGSFPQTTRRYLEQIRQIVREVVPAEAVETISYGIPTLKLGGRYVVYFAGYKYHVSVYPVPEGTEAFRRKIDRYLHGAGTARFSLEERLPEALIRQMVQLLLRVNQAHS